METYVLLGANCAKAHERDNVRYLLVIKNPGVLDIARHLRENLDESVITAIRTEKYHGDDSVEVNITTERDIAHDLNVWYTRDDQSVEPFPGGTLLYWHKLGTEVTSDTYCSDGRVLVQYGRF